VPAGGATSIATRPSLPRASARQGVTPSGMAPGGRAGLGSPGCGPKRMPRHAGRSERRSDRGFLAGVQPRRPPPRRVAEPGHRLPAARGRDPRRETAGASRHRPAPSRPRLPAARPRGHRPGLPRTRHALTVTSDHPMGAVQFGPWPPLSIHEERTSIDALDDGRRRPSTEPENAGPSRRRPRSRDLRPVKSQSRWKFGRGAALP